MGSVLSYLVDNWLYISSLLSDKWIYNFIINLLGYGILIVPGYFLVKRLQKLPKVETGQGPIYSILRLFALGQPPDLIPSSGQSAEATSSKSSSYVYSVKLVICIIGLQASYLTWGVLQERIMTKVYDGDRFTDSQFLVFINRVLALLVAFLYVSFTRQPRHVAPGYKYSFSSISNILSSWCQYEALKYVSFPTQVLAKSAKVIPVMLMGKLVSGRTYPIHEYVTALILSAGVSLFLLSSNEPGQRQTTETTISGIIILIGYMSFDSFTSNWQSSLFNTYKMKPLQMMLGVNFFSSTFTMTSMLFRGTLATNISFFFAHSDFIYHSVILSICSAVGQLFIFYTIEQFGPLIFTLIMTTRQAISILISCIVYGHTLDLQAIVGVGVVFIALFLRAYLNQRAKQLKQQKAKELAEQEGPEKA